MELDLSCKRDDGVLVATVSGPVTVDDIKRIVRDLTEAAKTEGVVRFLCDCRSASARISTSEFYDLPQKLLSAGASYSHKVAVVYSADSVNAPNLAFFDARCFNSSLPITVFTDYDKAYRWLLA